MGKVIAIAGKGGTGKTVLAALLLKALVRQGGRRLLAIDADSAISLPQALGVSTPQTVGDIREQIIQDPQAKRQIMDRHIREVVAEVVGAGEGFHLLVMGRGEGPGCFCAVNDLLRYGIETFSRSYDITLIDGEAGPEQVSRRVIERVDTLIIVTDTSLRGFQTAKLIAEIARQGAVAAGCRLGMVINRFRSEHQGLRELATRSGLDLLGCIPEDREIARLDAEGQPLLRIPEASPSFLAVLDMVDALNLATSSSG